MFLCTDVCICMFHIHQMSIRHWIEGRHGCDRMIVDSHDRTETLLKLSLSTINQAKLQLDPRVNG
jgi:hypothetical protein